MSWTRITRMSTSIVNYFKPHKQEAILRIRANVFGLVALFLLSYLLPIPSVLTALNHVLYKSGAGAGGDQRFGYGTATTATTMGEGSFYQWMCLIEATLCGIMGFNIMEGLYAVQYPRHTLSVPTPCTPVKPKTSSSSSVHFLSPPSANRSFKQLSPNTKPQSQRPFSASQQGLGGGSTSTSTSSYPSTPVSSPSKILHYSIPQSLSGSTFSTSIIAGSSPSPSPLKVSALGGRYGGDSSIPLDGSFLAELRKSINEESYDPFGGTPDERININ